MSEKLSEQQQVRLDKLSALKESGFNYPNKLPGVSSSSKFFEVCKTESELEVEKRKSFKLAGRLVAVRKMGKASFFQVQDVNSRFQVYIKRDEVGEESYTEFKSWDIGDLVTVEGYSFITKTGEPSIHASSASLLVKSLHPLPEKWHGLSDIEIRYRQRYLDLIVSPEVKEVFLLRSKILNHIRNFFNSRDYLEVETPVLTDISSGASARPFATHHNALDIDLNLRIALEIPLKKLLVGGLERVYEIGRVFRNEGISKEHNPEFTMIEFYQAYATYEDLMELTEELFISLCKEVIGKEQIEFGEQTIDFSGPWKRISMLDSIYEIGGISKDFDLNTIEGVHEAAGSVSLNHIQDEKDYGLALFKLFDEHVESKLQAPTFITRHPLSVSPLARKSEDDERFCDRFELFIAGMEVANAFNELNDPIDQRERLEAQMKLKDSGDEEAMSLDEDFLKALEIGMPPTAGQGIGIDRLVMLLTGQSSIRDVILFPQMRPQSN